MKIILPLVIFTLAFFCCTQISNVDKKNLDNLRDSTNSKGLNRNDTFSLTIFKTHYILSLEGHQQKIRTNEQLSETLKKGYNKRDSLYVFIDDATSDRIKDAMESIHNSKVDKYKVIVKNEFFKLPYPDQR